MKIVYLKVSACLLALMFSSASVMAQTTYTCSGVPQGVSIDGNGHLLVEQIGGLSWGKLCNVGEPMNGIAAAACKAVYGGLLTAQSGGRTVTIWINNNAGSCAGNTPWQPVVGWYFFRVGG